MTLFVLVTNSVKKINILNSNKYLNMEEVESFLERLSKLTSDALTLEFIGDTFIEGKDMVHKIYLVKIGDPRDHILYFDCGIHAREWISPASCLYVIQKLAIVFEYKNYILRSQKLIKWRPLLNYQWHFIPVLNPDGYFRSHEPDTDGEDTNRMQRKNMRPLKTMNITDDIAEKCYDEGGCFGVDLNRNFPSGWGMGHKSFIQESALPWTSVYKSHKPLSEPESQAVHKYIKKHRQKILSAISVHAYGREIYYAKGYLESDHPDQIKGPQRDLLREFAKYFNKALDYRIGTVSDLLDETNLCGGATDDYYSTYWKINISYTIELDPDISKFQVGFKLPPKEIKPVGKKLFHAVLLMARKMDQLYPHLKKYTRHGRHHKIRQGSSKPKRYQDQDYYRLY